MNYQQPDFNFNNSYQTRDPSEAFKVQNDPRLMQLPTQAMPFGSDPYGNESNYNSRLSRVGFMKNTDFSPRYLEEDHATTVPSNFAQQQLYEQQLGLLPQQTQFGSHSNPLTHVPNFNQRGNYHQLSRPQSTLISPPYPSQQRSFQPRQIPNTGGSDAQGRALNKMLLEILKDKNVDPHRLSLAVDANIERMDCVNLATLLFHTAKKRLLLTPSFIKRIAVRFAVLKEELRAREASNALYGLKCMSSESAEVRQLLLSLANKVSVSSSELVAQAVGNALYGCQNLTSDYEEVRYLLQILSVKVAQCSEPLEAQNVGNALYGMRGMNSDFREVRGLIASLTLKVATAREELNGQALGNSLYGLQCMSSKEPEVRGLLVVLSEKASRTWEDLKAQEVGNALYGLKRMSSDVGEVRLLINALVPKIAQSPEILDAQAIGNSCYGMQNMRSDNSSVLALLATMAEKISLSRAELDGQAMGNSLYGMQGMSSDHAEVRCVISAITLKLQQSNLEMNAQELGNALYGLQNMTTDFPEVRKLAVALSQKIAMSKHDLTSQEIGNALFGLQGMRSEAWEARLLARHMAQKISQSHSVLDPQGVANSIYGLQRMSCECKEVKLLCQALSLKIEQTWKVLGAQHVTNTIFGLQSLTNAAPEVAMLVRALNPKLASCRDELNARQLSCAIFGLQNMYSTGEEVLTLVGLLAEKVRSSPESMSGTGLSAALFGLQGMDDSSPEVQSLLRALAEKAQQVLEMDGIALGNAFYGLQRMTGQSEESREVLEVLMRFLSLANDFGMGASLSAPVCGRILYGLQHFPCSIEIVRNILRIVVARIKELVVGFVSECSVGLSAGQRPSKFSDLLQLYQCLSLALLNLPELEVDVELRDSLLEQQSLLTSVVEVRKLEFEPSSLTVPQSRLVEALSSLLREEPFTAQPSQLVFGFQATVFVQLNPSANLTSASGIPWTPEVCFEVSGSSRSFPAVELYTRLRNRYFIEQKSISVQEVPASLLAGQYQTCATIEKSLKTREGFLSPLFPPSMEDASQFSSTLSSLGLTGPGGLLSSVFDDEDSASSQSFRLGLGLEVGLEGGMRRVEPVGLDDYADDDYDGGILRLHRTGRGLYNPHSSQWLGEYPFTHGPRSSAERERDRDRDHRSDRPSTTLPYPPPSPALIPMFSSDGVSDFSNGQGVLSLSSLTAPPSSLPQSRSRPSYSKSTPPFYPSNPRPPSSIDPEQQWMFQQQQQLQSMSMSMQSPFGPTASHPSYPIQPALLTPLPPPPPPPTAPMPSHASSLFSRTNASVISFSSLYSSSSTIPPSSLQHPPPPPSSSSSLLSSLSVNSIPAPPNRVPSLSHPSPISPSTSYHSLGSPVSPPSLASLVPSPSSDGLLSEKTSLSLSSETHSDLSSFLDFPSVPPSQSLSPLDSLTSAGASQGEPLPLSLSAQAEEEGAGSEVDNELAILQAQLEIRRIEAQMLDYS